MAAGEKTKSGQGRQTLDGYGIDSVYVRTCTPEMAPSWLDHVALRAGFAPPRQRPTDKFHYCDLGCGLGTTAALLAASCPAGEFTGIDAMADHVAIAGKTTTRTGVSNTQFRCETFEQALSQNLGPFDYIACHGVLTWVSDAQRRHIQQFVAQFLKPGGLFYASYNTLPGHAAMAPARFFVAESVRAFREQPAEQRVKGARNLLGKLIDAGALCTRENPAYRALQAELDQYSSGYLTHEYLHDQWNLLHGADVQEEMAGAGLTYVGSAQLADNRQEFVLRRAQIELLAGIEYPRLRNLARDYLVNEHFRADIYAKRPRPIEVDETTRRRLGSTIALCVPAGKFTYAFKSDRAGLTVSFDNAAARFAVRCLSDGPKTVAAIAEQASAQSITKADILNIVDALLASKQCIPADPFDPAANVRAINDDFRREALSQDAVNAMASPYGALFPVTRLQSLLMELTGTQKSLERAVIKVLDSRNATAVQLFENRRDRRRSRTALKDGIRSFVKFERALFEACGLCR